MTTLFYTLLLIQVTDTRFPDPENGAKEKTGSKRFFYWNTLAGNIGKIYQSQTIDKFSLRGGKLNQFTYLLKNKGKCL